MTFYCTWCGDEVDSETVRGLGKPLKPTGRCEDDGIVYVTTDPEEAEA